MRRTLGVSHPLGDIIKADLSLQLSTCRGKALLVFSFTDDLTLAVQGRAGSENRGEDIPKISLKLPQFEKHRISRFYDFLNHL